MKYNDTFEKLVMGEFPKNLIRNVYPIAPKTVSLCGRHGRGKRT